MGSLYKRFLRRAIFKLEAERAHEFAVDALKLLGAAPGLRSLVGAANRMPGWAEPTDFCGLSFPSRVGVAAGFDKNAVCWRGLAALGFGHVEAGTVTFRPQPGNPRPRLFRYPEREAILNRMGFNNDGAPSVAARLARLPGPGRRPIPLGINIGKSKIAPLDQAAEDYLGSFGLLADHADYVAVNVSSPNTPELRRLQEAARLRGLLGALSQANKERERLPGKRRRPIFLKIAPDLSEPQLDAVLEVLRELEFDGIIATNTTMSREGPFAFASGEGGLSGRPLEEMATRVVAFISKATSGRLPIIGVGGIRDADTAARKLDAGASLVQVYTGMIYEGPLLGKRIGRALARREREEG